MQTAEAVARLRVVEAFEFERGGQSRLGLFPTPEAREHDAEVVLRARVVAATLRDGLPVSLDRRLRLAQARERVPSVVEELRVEPLLREHRAKERDRLRLVARLRESLGQSLTLARALSGAL